MVSGFMRSGTSMMMEALIAGGMPAAYEPSRDDMNEEFGDDSYKPNEGGFYELASEHYKVLDFPLPYRGRLIKGLLGALHRLPVAKYRIVLMVREPEEIRQSYRAFFDKPCPSINGREFDDDAYCTAVGWHISQLANRRDTTLTVLKYRDTVRDPLRAFSELFHAGWPIRPSDAAAVVDPSKCRFKAEELTRGI